MHSPHNTDDEIEIQLGEAEQMIMEHDSSKEPNEEDLMRREIVTHLSDVHNIMVVSVMLVCIYVAHHRIQHWVFIVY